jgi:hypothetical protein
MSKDLDYFGSREAAEKLARALGGELMVPEFGDATPQTAVVRAIVDGRAVEIDFLSNVLGVAPKSLVDEAVELVVPVRTEGGAGTMAIPVMHPLHCLQSRVANAITLRRNDDTSIRQLNAAPIVLQCYIDELLADGDAREARHTLQALFDYLDRDILGRQAHRVMAEDPARIIDAFRSDKRLDIRFRWFNLRAMSRRIARRRQRGQPD